MDIVTPQSHNWQCRQDHGLHVQRAPTDVADQSTSTLIRLDMRLEHRMMAAVLPGLDDSRRDTVATVPDPQSSGPPRSKPLPLEDLEDLVNPPFPNQEGVWAPPGKDRGALFMGFRR